MSDQTTLSPAVAVVIPTWNTLGYLQRCTESLMDQDEPLELLIIDNGSSDGTSRWLDSANIKYHALPSNIGFAAAVNLGAKLTRAPFVFVLNADCVLQGSCLVKLRAALESDSRLGGVQPVIVQDAAAGQHKWIYSRGQYLSRSGYAYESGWGETAEHMAKETWEVFGLSGAACLLRRELFSDLGGYDERFFAFYEDVDLNARARLAGWRFACVGDAIARHTGHAAWTQQAGARAFNARLTTQNRITTAVKVLPPSGVLLMVTGSARWLLTSIYHRTTRATLAGVAGAMRQLPSSLRERRRLRTRTAAYMLDSWLTWRVARNPMLASVLPSGQSSGRARDAILRALARMVRRAAN